MSFKFAKAPGFGLIRPLFDGPLDIVGDVHGEHAALRHLLIRLGYDEQGLHPRGRRLVFVGDLVDRGPDSPAVVRQVAKMVSRGLAQCVIGNHELNLLRDVRRHGNHWAYPGQQTPHEAVFGPCATVGFEEARQMRLFFDSLPVALEREDLRIVHAAWEDTAAARLRTLSAGVLSAHDRFEHEAARSPQGKALAAAAAQEQRQHAKILGHHGPMPPMLKAVAAFNAYRQNSNPLRVMTSGLEEPIEAPYYASGKWRFVDRVAWWSRYTAPPVVVFGHYWRFWHAKAQVKLSPSLPSLFTGSDPLAWHRNHESREVAFCCDYSVGARYKERTSARQGPFQGRLAALRLPERQVFFDGDEPLPLKD